MHWGGEYLGSLEARRAPRQGPWYLTLQELLNKPRHTGRLARTEPLPRGPNTAAPLIQALPGYEARVARRDYSREEKARRAELRRQDAEARRRGPGGLTLSLGERTAAASAGGTGEAPVWPPSLGSSPPLEEPPGTPRPEEPGDDGNATEDQSSGLLLPESSLDGAGGPVQPRSRAGSAESSRESLARGVVVPRLEDVQRVAMRERWPLRVGEEDGWVIAIVPCFEDFADEMDHVLRSWGAVAPPPPEEHRPPAGGRLEAMPQADPHGVTWLAGPTMDDPPRREVTDPRAEGPRAHAAPGGAPAPAVPGAGPAAGVDRPSAPPAGADAGIPAAPAAAMSGRSAWCADPSM